MKIIIILTLLALVFVVGCNTYVVEEDNRIKFNDNQSQNRFIMSVKPPDYSEEGYYQVTPIPDKLIFLECINSTLRINNTSIYCEKQEKEDGIRFNDNERRVMDVITSSDSYLKELEFDGKIFHRVGCKKYDGGDWCTFIDDKENLLDIVFYSQEGYVKVQPYNKFEIVNMNARNIFDITDKYDNVSRIVFRETDVFVFREANEIDYDMDISKYESMINENCGNDTNCKIKTRECLRSKKCDLFTEGDNRFNVVNNNDEATIVSRIIFSEINKTGVVFLSIYSKDNDTIIVSYEDKIIGKVSKKILCGKYEK